MRKAAYLLAVMALSILAGCAGVSRDGPPPMAERADIAALEAGILALGPGIDPEEAARAARVAYEHTHRLALEYEIVDGPIVHNMKVNAGVKPRGLCRHWAEDMEARLALEGFETLELHRAIANADNPFRLEHSTVIVSRRGDDMQDGMVLDPWRKGGILFWEVTRADTDYRWVPRAEVLEVKRQRLEAREVFQRGVTRRLGD